MADRVTGPAPTGRLVAAATRRWARASPQPLRLLWGPAGRLRDVLRRHPAHYRALYALDRAHPRPPGLVQIHLEPTNACNLRCRGCHQPDAAMPLGLMPLPRARHLIDEAWSLLGPTGTLGFFIRGESTLHPELASMVAYARGLGFRRLLLSSNLTRLEPPRAAALLDAGLSELRISIDSADPAELARLRPGTDLARVEAHLHALAPLARGRCHLRLHATLDRRGLDEAPSLVARFGPWVDRIQLTCAVNQGGLDEGAAPTPTPAFTRSTRWQLPCRLLFEYQGITWDGRANSCCVDYSEAFMAGRLTPGSSMAALFHGERAAALRQAHRRGALPVLCQRCGFANALVDYFEDELNERVRRQGARMGRPAAARRYRRWLAATIARFDRLAQEGP